MNKYFKNGYDYVADTFSGNLGGQVSNHWIDSVNKEIDTMVEEMITKAAKKNSSANFTQGFIAEDWHAHTFNVNALIHHSNSYADVPDVNSYGSADISLGYKTMFDKYVEQKYYSLKYYGDANSSYKAQAETPYNSYEKSHSGLTENEFYSNRNVDSELSKYSMYYGQGKIIPADQLEKAKDLLSRRIARETANGKTELVNQYKEVLNTLDDVISDGKGNSSLALTREQSQKLAVSAKNGNIEKELLEECGLDVNKLVTPADIMNEAFSAGLTAAMISMIITVAPTVINGISMLISNGEIDLELFKEFGVKSLTGFAKGFVNGSITAAVVAACKTGKLGPSFIETNPSIISACVVMTLATIETSIKYAAGKITKTEMATEITRMSFTTVFSIAGGLAFGALLPKSIAPLSYMLGSFIGSILGGFIYKGTERLLLSYCIESGCTFFGLVTQDYQLPTEILNELDIDLIKPIEFEHNHFEHEKLEIDSFIPDDFMYEKIDVKILKRGLIEAYSIGYL